MIIDIHTHAFPDNLAGEAMNKLAYSSKVKPSFDGSISGLLSSMDRAGIEKAAVLNIATKPEQVFNIIKWCLKIKSDRIVPFASVHPDNGDIKDLIKRIKGEGLLGIKLHPMYQDFYLDDDKMFFIYEEVAVNGLILIFHTGLDIAFRSDRRAEVKRLKRVIGKIPGLKIVATHTGSWQMWNDVLSEIAGLDVWLETSMTLKYIEDKKIFLEILKKHSPDRIMFGTDAPWSDQKEEVELINDLDISNELKYRIFSENAQKLLSL